MCSGTCRLSRTSNHRWRPKVVLGRLGRARTGSNNFAALVTSEARRLPVIGFTPREDDVVDGGVLLKKLIGIAHVVLILPAASWLLDNLLPEGLNVYGGAVRLWWPGIGGTSSRWDHPLWFADNSAQEISERIVEQVRGASLSVATTDRRIAQLESRERDRQFLVLSQEVGRLQSEYQRALHDSNTAIGSSTAVAEAMGRLQQAQARTIEDLRVDRALFEELANSYEQDAQESRQRAWASERESAYWKQQFLGLQSILAAKGLPSEPDNRSELRAEIQAEVDRYGEVEAARPRDFRIGPLFIDKLTSQGAKYRSKVVKACADIVVNAPGVLARRDDHALRAGEGANDPLRVRSRDGAEARRCYIEQGTPSARRLHYWLLDNGGIEFAVRECS